MPRTSGRSSSVSELNVFDTLASGFMILEGPRPDGRGGLYCSDLGGGVHRLGPDGAVKVVVPKRRMVGGVALHADGGVVVSGRSVCHVRDGQSRELAPAVDGMVYNDLACDASGRIYVGSVSSPLLNDSAEHRAGALSRIDAPGDLTMLVDGIGIPNGVGISPDGTRLYHVDSARRHVLVHSIATSGELTDGRVLVDLSMDQDLDFGFPPRLPTPDGLAVDTAGGVWVALLNGGSVRRFTDDGREDVTVDIPAKLVTSLAFDDGDMYIVTGDNTEAPDRGGTVFRTRTPYQGAPVHPARV